MVLVVLLVWGVGVGVSVSRLMERRRALHGSMVPTMDLTDALAALERAGDEGVRDLPEPQPMTLRLEPRLVIAEPSEMDELSIH